MEIPSTHHPDRSYHTFSIPSNDLRCCVVSDTKADKAAAAIAVNAGQLHDSLEGIAHLTEHMLFMGSKSFPGEWSTGAVVLMMRAQWLVGSRYSEAAIFSYSSLTKDSTP